MGFDPFSGRLTGAGKTGPAGAGVPTGGTAGQVLGKTSSADFDTGWVDQSGGAGGGVIGYGTYSSVPDATSVVLTLTTSAASLLRMVPAVYREVAGASASTTTWDVAPSESGWHAKDHAPAQALTPSATSGEMVTFTLSSGAWPPAIEGYQIVQVAGAGQATVIKVIDAVTVKAKITAAFPNTNPIAAGFWRLGPVQCTTSAPGEAILGSNGAGGNDRHCRFLLLSEAANGSSVFSDAGPFALGITGGAAVHSTSYARFGTSSIHHPATTNAADAMAIADSSVTRLTKAGPWTIDFWRHVSAGATTSGYYAFVQKGQATPGVTGWSIATIFGSSDGMSSSYKFQTWNGASLVDSIGPSASIHLPTNAWHHYAIVNEGAGVIKLYLDGEQKGSGTLGISEITAEGQPIRIGYDKYNGGSHSQYLECLRLSEVARWTGNFTPPTAPYASGERPMGAYHAIISDGDHLDTSAWIAIDGVTVTETAGGGALYYAVSADDRHTWSVYLHGHTPVTRRIASNLASVTGGADGTWHVNTNATYSTETWTPSAINTAYDALAEAMAVGANRMPKALVEALTGSDIPTIGSTLNFAAILRADAPDQDPRFDGATIHYTTTSEWELAAGYQVVPTTTSTVRVRTPSGGGPHTFAVTVLG